MTNGVWPVINGPSREALFDSLRLWTKNISVQVSFVQDGVQVSKDMRILGINLEDGSGESWFGTGRLGGVDVDYYLHTQRRTGWIRPIPK